MSEYLTDPWNVLHLRDFPYSLRYSDSFDLPLLHRDFPYSLRHLQFASGYEPGSHHNVQQPANQDL
jgi:hypothetical protein